ncbi:hypothetical protein LIER_39988 [Lithospermum erythrorhizon]|uniref:SWIM-type domain-containing protein n=1 Tax=Lithospermum erythrorhizon TaxID=34254 RepID=A0AAV3QN46_LITER
MALSIVIGTEKEQYASFWEYFKCDILLNNLYETFNKQILVVRGKPIISLLEDMRQYINGRIRKQIAACHKYKGRICPLIQKLLEDNKINASAYSQVWNGGNEFEVYHVNGEKQVVDMGNKTCTCRKWQLTGIPCCHVVKGCKYRCQKPKDLVDDYYTKDTFMKCYNNVLHPPLPPEMWKKCGFSPIIPPHYTTKRGRIQVVRRKEHGELIKGAKLSRKGKSSSCSNYCSSTHNKRTCRLC